MNQPNPKTSTMTTPHAKQNSMHESASAPTLTTYRWVLGWLLLLLLLTAGAHHLLSGQLSLITAMLIAVAKATLVICVFMHLKYETGVIRLFALAGFFWLAILIVLTLADFLTRS